MRTKNREHWDGVYRRKGPEKVIWYRPHLEHSLRFIEGANLARDAAIIDVGGVRFGRRNGAAHGDGRLAARASGTRVAVWTSDHSADGYRFSESRWMVGMGRDACAGPRLTGNEERGTLGLCTRGSGEVPCRP